MAASVSFNGNKITKELDLIVQVQLPFIASLTLNGRRGRDISLAFELQEDLRDHMARTFTNYGRETKKFIVKRSTKKDLTTIVKHKDRFDSKPGNPPSKYLLPQIQGGQVYRTRFQRRLVAKGYMPEGHYMMPIVNGKPGWGIMSKGMYTKALWGISAMEELRGKISRKGVDIYKKNAAPEYKTQGTFIHVPRNLAEMAKQEPKGTKGGMRSYAGLVRQLNYGSTKKGAGKLPPGGIYKVQGKSLKMVFAELDYIPSVSAQYKFKETSEQSVNRNFKRIFDMKVKEVLEKG
tara:strand:- start:30 stop:902 length:873 start_codon:yes stop_codon:yes gene_type:complete